MKSVKSLGNFNNRGISPRNPTVESVSDISASQQHENGLRSSHISGKHLEIHKVTNFVPYLPSGYYPSKLAKSTSNQARNHLAQNSSQQLASEEYSMNQAVNKTLDPAQRRSKESEKAKILNLNSFQIARSSHNSNSTLGRNQAKEITQNNKQSMVSSLNNLHQSLRNLQQLKNSAFIQPGGVSATHDANNSDEGETARSIYNKVLSDYALKPSYTSKNAQNHKEIGSHRENSALHQRANLTQEARKIQQIASSGKPHFEKVAIYSQSPRHANNTHHLQNPLRQAYASSFEYGTNSNGNITLSKELEKVSSGDHQRPFQIKNHKPDTKTAPLVQIKSGKPGFYIRQGNHNPDPKMDLSTNHNESSFLDRIAQDMEQNSNSQNQMAQGTTWKNPIYYQKVYSSQIHPPAERTRNVAMNNNIHINMKFAPLNDLGIVPSQIILTPKITSTIQRTPGNQNSQQIDFQTFSVSASGKKRLKRVSSKSSKGAKSSKSIRSAKKSTLVNEKSKEYYPSTKRF